MIDNCSNWYEKYFFGKIIQNSKKIDLSKVHIFYAIFESFYPELGAAVEGTNRYNVSIDLETMEGRCECAFFEKTGCRCKHMAAVLRKYSIDIDESRAKEIHYTTNAESEIEKNRNTLLGGTEARKTLLDEYIERNLSADYLNEPIDRLACSVESKPLSFDNVLYTRPSTYGKKSPKKSLNPEEIFKHVKETFSESLFRIIDEKNLSDVEVYKAAQIDRKLFSKMRNPDYKPGKDSAIRLCLALKLGIDDTLDLLAKAGFTLSQSSKKDLIIRYCIESELFDIFDINTILDEYNLPLLVR